MIRFALAALVAAAAVLVPSFAKAETIAASPAYAYLPEPQRAPPGRTNIFVLQQDEGGLVAAYDERYAAYHATRTKVVVNGLCASSCTRLIFKRLGVDACATPRAQLGFHKPFDFVDDYDWSKGVLTGPAQVRWSNAHWQSDWLANMTPKQRAFFKGKHVPSASETGDNTKMISVKGSAMGLFLKPCPRALTILTEGGTHGTNADTSAGEPGPI